MVSQSPKQARTMAAIAHGDKGLGKKLDIPVGVAKDFNKADTGKGIIKPKAKPANGTTPNGTTRRLAGVLDRRLDARTANNRR